MLFNKKYLVSLTLLSLVSTSCTSLREKATDNLEHSATQESKSTDQQHAQASANSHASDESHHGRVPGKISADQAFKWLKNGNQRFATGKLRKDGASQTDIVRLSTGQKPHAIVLSCSDSRVPPEVVFDQKLGEIFTVRTAGEVLDFGAIASIEYAVEHLGSNLIVVMGHTSCGAVKAAHSTKKGDDVGSPNLNALVADIQPRIHRHLRSPASDNYVVETWDNTRGVAEDLMKRSAIVRAAVESGQVKIQSGVYHLNTGKVEFTN